MKKNYRIIGVISSSRYNGNTASMVREALRSAEEEGLLVTEVFLPDYKMEFCSGCLVCMKEGKCRLNDDFNALRDLLYEADGIIWGSPTYAAAPNARMKNLIDRLGMYEVSTSSLGGKYMAGISAASSSSAARKVARGLARFGSNGTFMRSFNSGCLGIGFSGGRKAPEDKRALRKARELGKRVSMDIIKGRSYPMQNLTGRLISRLIMKPVFSKYVAENKDGDTKVLYASLKKRNLIS